MKKRKGQFYIISAIFVVVFLYLLSYTTYYDKSIQSNSDNLLELYKIKEITNNVDYLLSNKTQISSTCLQLQNYNKIFNKVYNQKLIEVGCYYNTSTHTYNVTLIIKGEYNKIYKEYEIKK